MWFRGTSAEIAVQCPHCKARDWRMSDELKTRRLFCFSCGRFSVWPPEGEGGGAETAASRPA